mmetsp:Transcript_16799/g.36866  ORF Transcript_16799/g.36866 Transcript_16799/m.36866 type:complete len:94 (-) Transcript_16799:208-489(-)
MFRRTRVLEPCRSGVACPSLIARDGDEFVERDELDPLVRLDPEVVEHMVELIEPRLWRHIFTGRSADSEQHASDVCMVPASRKLQLDKEQLDM